MNEDDQTNRIKPITEKYWYLDRKDGDMHFGEHTVIKKTKIKACLKKLLLHQILSMG